MFRYEEEYTPTVVTCHLWAGSTFTRDFESRVISAGGSASRDTHNIYRRDRFVRLPLEGNEALVNELLKTFPWTPVTVVVLEGAQRYLPGLSRYEIDPRGMENPVAELAKRFAKRLKSVKP